MNIQEFATLKVGDKIENHSSSSVGEIVAVDKMGLRVQWGMVTSPNAPSFHYSVQGTAWFHWSKVEDEAHIPD